MIDDTTLLALCLWSEAAGEPDEGKEAVARVVLNRMARHYESDGTVTGTVLHPNQFSGFWFDFIDGKYRRVCWTREDAEARAEQMLPHAQRQGVWPECYAIAQMALDGKLPDEPGLSKAVLYLNPSIIPKLPVWANPDKALCAVGHHTFYEA